MTGWEGWKEGPLQGLLLASEWVTSQQRPGEQGISREGVFQVEEQHMQRSSDSDVACVRDWGGRGRDPQLPDL